jgi:hypothetical protein
LGQNWPQTKGISSTCSNKIGANTNSCNSCNLQSTPNLDYQRPSQRQKLSCSHHTRDELDSLTKIVQTQNSNCCWKCHVLGFTSFGHCLQMCHMLGVPKSIRTYYQHFQHTNSQISSLSLDFNLNSTTINLLENNMTNTHPASTESWPA